ncbi:NAD(P)/FAD-dependent oxidoreductase [Bacillus sp. T3]|uniref:NAD(P)/FAD-dependent oxidoreductase n=1 Tax=Bacillus sp. T3 TaxID=467262 RepID=UPI0029816DC5|nr:FAD-dependent monooxygenase [Bacillus sp. T3]
MERHGKAIIIGGGISGKLAARVMSDFFMEIVILERDPEPDGPFPRKGARQGEHLHALLHAGENGLEELFPGITGKFHQSGALKINSTKDLAWFHHGVWKLRFDGGYSTTLQTRPHLEWHIEQYIKAIPNVSIFYNQSVGNYLYNKEQNRITGVQVKETTNTTKNFTADLIVDASGAGSFSTGWLKELGITIPHHKVEIGLSYVSQLFHLPDNVSRDWKIKLLYPTPPHEKIGGTISKVEGERYIVTIMGYQHEIYEKEVLENDNGFLALTRRLPKLDIYHEIKDGTPLSKPSIYRVPFILWKRFDKLKELPDGLLLIGDTVCRIDPVFGQGMSLAVLEALTLQKLLRESNNPLQKTISIFHKNVSKIISPIWNMVVTEDFRYHSISGKKPLGLRLQQWYAKNIFLLSAKDETVLNAFIKVMNLVKPITILMQPKILLKVIAKSFSNK